MKNDTKNSAKQILMALLPGDLHRLVTFMGLLSLAKPVVPSLELPEARDYLLLGNSRSADYGGKWVGRSMLR